MTFVEQIFVSLDLRPHFLVLLQQQPKHLVHFLVLLDLDFEHRLQLKNPWFNLMNQLHFRLREVCFVGSDALVRTVVELKQFIVKRLATYLNADSQNELRVNDSLL